MYLWKDLAKVSRLFGLRIFLLKTFKIVRLVWYVFSYGFLVVLNLFHQCFFQSYY
jgi:hypothetical protein